MSKKTSRASLLGLVGLVVSRSPDRDTGPTEGLLLFVETFGRADGMVERPCHNIRGESVSCKKPPLSWSGSDVARNLPPRGGGGE
jgi:hypothetical protein